MRRHAFREEAIAGPQSGRIQQQIVRLVAEFQARFDYFQELKPCFAFFVNPFIVNVVSDGCPICQPLVTNVSAVETKLTDSKKTLVNDTLQLISGHRFQKIPRICKTSVQIFSVYSTTYRWDFFLCNEVRKIKPSCKTLKMNTWEN